MLHMILAPNLGDPGQHLAPLFFVTSRFYTQRRVPTSALDSIYSQVVFGLNRSSLITATHTLSIRHPRCSSRSLRGISPPRYVNPSNHFSTDFLLPASQAQINATRSHVDSYIMSTDVMDVLVSESGPVGLNSPPDSNPAMRDGGSDSELSDIEPESDNKKIPLVIEPVHWEGGVPVFKPCMDDFVDFERCKCPGSLLSIESLP